MRQPICERYDALVDFLPTDNLAPSIAYGLVKLTYTIGAGHCALAPAEPLIHDIRDPANKARLAPGSDFWPQKLATDVVVTGSAWHPGGVAACERTVKLRVGERSKSLAVLGDRVVTGMQGSLPIFSQAQPFTEMPVIHANAYGGCDMRVAMPSSDALRDVLARQFDHPGIYPRNPFGKGYVVEPRLPSRAIALPNLEDPHDRLTPQRFFVHDPRAWARQPLPWCLDWCGPLMYHRYAWLGEDAWFSAPEDLALTEVQKGFLPRGFRSVGKESQHGSPWPLAFLQEASLGMAFAALPAGTPIELTGMHPEIETYWFRLPAAPALSFACGQEWTAVQPRLHSVLLLPGQKTMQMVYAATYVPQDRRYVPGVHRNIPLAMRVANDAPVAYTVPEAVGEAYRAIAARR